MLYAHVQAPTKAEKSRVVPAKSQHKFKPGDGLMKYDKTLKIGKTVIHIVAPPPMTEEEVDRVLDDYHKAGWAIIDEMLEKEEGINKLN